MKKTHRARAANSAFRRQSWPKLKIIRDIMVVLVTSKNEEDQIRIEATRFATKGQLIP